MGRGSQGQGTRDGSLPFEDQVAGEGEISSDSAFPSQRRAFETVCTTGRASALSGASLEEAAIDVSSPRPRMLREQVMRPPSAQCGVQGFPGWHQGEGRSNRRAHRDRVLNPLFGTTGYRQVRHPRRCERGYERHVPSFPHPAGDHLDDCRGLGERE